MKKLLYGSLVAFFAVILLILVVPNFIDWSHYKRPIATAVKAHTGFDLDLKGPVHLQILPTPHLSAEDVFIKNKSGGQAENLIELKSFSLNADFIPLLFGEIIIRQVELIQPVVFLETFKNGENNWDMKTNSSSSSSSEKSSSPEISEGSTKKLVFSLKKIKIKEGMVTLTDLQKNTQQEIKDINLEGSMDSLGGPFAIKGGIEINEYKVKGEVNTGEIDSQKQSPLTSKISITKDNQEYGTLSVEGNVLDKKFIGTLKSDTLKIPFSLDLQHKKFDLQKGIQVSAQVEAESQNIKVSNINLKSDALKISGNINYKAPQVECNLTLSEGPSLLSLFAKGQSGDKSLWNGDVGFSSDNPHVFLGWVGLEGVPYLKGKVNISTHLNVQSNTYGLSSLKFEVGDLKGSGKATINLDSHLARPYISADISVNALNLNSYLLASDSPENSLSKHENLQVKGGPKASHSPATSTPTSSPPPSSERWSKEPFDLKVLKMIDTDFTFNIGVLFYDKYQFQKVKGVLQLKDGNLILTAFQTLLYEGELKGDASIHQGSSIIFKINSTLHGINLGSLPQIKETPLKKATLNSSMHLSATGKSISENIHTLSGNIKLTLINGVIEAFNVKKFVNEIKSIRTPLDITNLIAGTRKKSDTTFSHINGDFSIQEGKATTRNIEFLSEDIQVNAQGTINIPQWTLNMDAKIKVKALSGLPPLGMTIEGSLDSPSYNIDADFLAKVLVGGAATILIDSATGIGGVVGGVVGSVLGGEDDSTSAQSTSPKKKADSSVKPEKFIKNLLGL